MHQGNRVKHSSVLDSVQKVEQGACHHLRGAPQVFQLDVFVGALALLSSTVRGPQPYSAAGMPCSQYSRASVYSGVPDAVIGSPNNSLACRHSASTSGLLPGSGFSELASRMRLMSTRIPGLSGDRVGNDTADRGFHLGRVLLGDHAPVSFSSTLPGTTLVLVPPSMLPTFR